MIKVKSTKITNIKNGIRGYFKLTDGSKTNFEIDKQGEWYQWGNTTDNLTLTVPRIYNIINTLIFDDK